MFEVLGLTVLFISVFLIFYAFKVVRDSATSNRQEAIKLQETIADLKESLSEIKDRNSQLANIESLLNQELAEKDKELVKLSSSIPNIIFVDPDGNEVTYPKSTVKIKIGREVFDTLKIFKDK